MQGTRTSGRHVWREYLERRQEARETAMSADEFGPIETAKFDLDTARIDGMENPASYRIDPLNEDADVVEDYREVDPIFG